MGDALRLGVDLGGTKTEAVVVELGGEAGGPGHRVLSRVRLPTQRELGYEQIVRVTAAAIADATREAGLAAPPAIGVGMPGSVTFRRDDGARSAVALIKNSNTTCLNGRPFHDDLIAAVSAPIWFANDANCFALAEAALGAARGARVTFGVIMGTGVGGGIAWGAPPRVWDGRHGIAGEWGHVSLDPEGGPPCYCGKRGCIEQYLSGPAVERAYLARAGVQRSLRELASDASTDAHAAQVLGDLVARFGQALSIVLNVLDPDVIVLGGGLSNLDILYDRGVAALAPWVFNDEVTTPIVRNTLGDSAGVLGAALLPPRSEQRGAVSAQ